MEYDKLFQIAIVKKKENKKSLCESEVVRV